MTDRSRRGVRLASVLVAAGLGLTALTAMPAGTAHADDAPLGRILTDAQADALEQRVEPAAPLDVTPQDDGRTPQQLRSTEETTAGGGLALNRASALETYQGQADTAQLGGGHGDFLAVHSMGTVTRLTADGRTAWKRDNASLYADWQVTPIRPWQTEPGPARITIGYHANSPFLDASDRGWAQGDLTGDGVADVVFTADVGNSPYRPFTSPGSPLTTGTFVTVLDGATGRTLWSRLYADAQQVTLVGDTLVIGDQPSTNPNAAKDATASLQALRFTPDADRKLTATTAWTYRTGARDGRWGSTLPLGDGLLAVSWYVKKTATAPAAAHTLVLDTADGAVKWRTDGDLYGRQLALDTARGRLVALEQADHRDGIRYEIAAYDPADGTRTTLDTRVNALAVGLRVGELRGEAGPEYVVSESTLDPYLYVNTATVRALDGADARELWAHTVKRDESNSKDGDSALGLRIVDGRVLASYFTTADKDTAANAGAGRYGTLLALAGRDGSVRWQHKGPDASPIYAQPYREDDEWRVRTDNEQNVRSYRLGSGRQASVHPLQGNLHSGLAADVNGDGRKDVVVGGQSQGLWAYDGPSLAAGSPKLLWQTTLPGSVQGDLRIGDTDGDGHDDDLVVAADHAAVVVDAHTGRVRERVDGRGGFVRSVTVADLDGDGADELLVPTDAVRAYSGSGRKLWEYAPGTGLVFSDLAVADGRVLGSYQTRGVLDGSATVGGMALDAATGALAWEADPTWTGDPDTRIYAAQLYHGVYASPAVPYADGHAVVHSWIVREGAWWTTYFEFRDIRSGKVVRTATGGGAWTVGNWFTGDEGLLLAGTASLRTFHKDGGEYEVYTLPTLHRAEFATGPGGRRLVVGGTEGAAYVWDPAVLTAGRNYPEHLAKLAGYATQNIVVADLTGDGVDEVVGLGKDDTGFDRTIELSGGRQVLSDSSLHGMITGVLSLS
ncbi:hypothetical protein [Streptomyces sp. NPDC127114]|uniref:hypothetical protein n=1 Tax=Streptomyces sp. NPDC127114 TaxID=3345366 RepID=UPI0036290B7A